MPNNAIIAVDLGATYMSIAIQTESNDITLISNEENETYICSCFGYIENNVVKYDAAKQQLSTNPNNTIINYKLLCYHDNTNVICYIPDNKYTLEKIYDELLNIIKNLVKSYNILEIIFTVQIQFSIKYRELLMKTAISKGFNNVSFINVTSACAYIYYKNIKNTSSNILIFDLGANNLNASIIAIDKNQITVKAAINNIILGYEFDNCIIKYIIDKLNLNNIDNKTIAKIMLLAENTKKILTTSDTTSIDLETLNIINKYIVLTKSDFNDLCYNIYNKINNILDELLLNSTLKNNDINEIILLGGNSKIPKIKEILKLYFSNANIITSITKEDVVKGALIYKKMSDITLNDINTFIYGVKVDDDTIDIFINKNTHIPFSVSHKINNKYDTIKIVESYSSSLKDSILINTINISNLQSINNLMFSFTLDSNCLLHYSDIDAYRLLLISKLEDIKERVKFNNTIIKEIICDEIINIYLWIEYNNLTSKEYLNKIYELEMFYINTIENTSSSSSSSSEEILNNTIHNNHIIPSCNYDYTYTPLNTDDMHISTNTILTNDIYETTSNNSSSSSIQLLDIKIEN